MIQMRHAHLVASAVFAAFALHASAVAPVQSQGAAAQAAPPPAGGESGCFRPQLDPALVPSRPDLSLPTRQPDEMASEVEKAELRRLRRLRAAEEQMDRAESEAAKAQEQIRQYLPGQPPAPAPALPRT